MTDINACGCCEGITKLTPVQIVNRHGLSALKYRIGTQATIFETLLARLSTFCLGSKTDCGADRGYILRDLLTTRDKTDPSIALLDSWATLADILSFYQERIANEGYLRTAQDLRSLYELSRLVGYRPRPGVSSTVYLAFEVEDLAQNFLSAQNVSSASSEVLIPVGTAVKSTPTPGSHNEPQTFETSRDLLARSELNAMRPRLTRPQAINGQTARSLSRLYFKGLGLRLEPNNLLAVMYGRARVVLHQIMDVKEDSERQITVAQLKRNPLSESDLIDDINELIAEFADEATMPRDTLLLPDDDVPDTAERVRDLVKAKIASVIAKSKSKPPVTLTELDTEIQDLVCQDLLAGDVPKLAQDSTAMAKDIVKGLEDILETTLQTVRDEFVRSAKLPLEALRDEDDRYVDPIKLSIKGPPKALPIVKTLGALRNLVPDVTPSSPPLIAALAIPADVPADSAVLPDVAAVDAPSASDGQTVATLRVASGELSALNLKLTTTGYTINGPTGIGAIKDTWLMIRNADSNPVSIDKALASVTLDGQPHHPARRVCIVSLVDPAAPNRRLATTAAQFKFKNDNREYEIKQLAKVRFCRENLEWDLFDSKVVEKIDGPDSNRFAARVTVTVNFESDPDGTGPGYDRFTCTSPGPFNFKHEPNSPVATLILDPNVETTLAKLNNALQTTFFRPARLGNPRTIQLEIFTVPLTADPHPPLDNIHPKAVAIRHAIVYSPKSFDTKPPLVVGLATFHDKISNSKTVPSTFESLYDDILNQEYWDTRKLTYDGDDSALTTLDDPTKTLSEKAKKIEALPTVLGSDTSHKRMQKLKEALETASKSAAQSLESEWRGKTLNEVDALKKEYGSFDSTFQFFLLQSRGVVERVSIASGPLRKRAATVEDATELLKKSVGRLTLRYDWLERELKNLADDFTKALNEKRKEFHKRSIRAINSNDFPFQVVPATSTDTLGLAAKRIRELKAMLGTRSSALQVGIGEPGTLAKQICDDCKAPADQANICQRLTAAINVIRKEVDPSSDSAVENLRHILNSGSLEASSKEAHEALDRMLDELEALLEQVDPRDVSITSDIGSSPGSLEEALSELSQLRATMDQSLRGQILRDLQRLFLKKSDLIVRVAKALDPVQRTFLYDLLRQARIDDPALEPKVFVFRSTANVFGWNAQDPGLNADQVFERIRKNVACLADADVGDGKTAKTNVAEFWGGRKPPCLEGNGNLEGEKRDRVFLDGSFTQTIDGTLVAIARPPRPSKKDKTSPDDEESAAEFEPVKYDVTRAVVRPRSAYELRGTATVLDLKTGWWNPSTNCHPNTVPGDAVTEGFEVIRTSRVYCDPEELLLADQTIDTPLDHVREIELDSLVEGLESGRQIIIEGTPRLAATNTRTRESEQAEIIDVQHDVNKQLYGDTFKTKITLNRAIQFTYSRESFLIYANVAQATHGESQREVLGSGDGAKEFQKFALKRTELSQVPAPSPQGTESTLSIRVNDILWTEVEKFNESREKSEHYVPLTDAERPTVVVFGDGVKGGRPPTGVENVRAEYRSGLGRKGNVAAAQINQVVGASMGVKGVKNPLPALGGADPEPVGLIREHAPLGVLAMDRLVSVQDFADFSASYAGIGKANASLLKGIVYVTVARMDTEPFSSDGPVLKNLKRALELYGDPSQRFELLPREVALLIIAAKVRIEPRYVWDECKARIRTALLDRFSYERSRLGQDVLLSDAVATIQALKGVVFADMEIFDAVNEQDVNFLVSRLDCLQLRPRIRVSLERLTSDYDEMRTLDNECLRKIDDARKRQEEQPGNRGQRASLKPDQTIARIRGAQLCYLPPDVPDALILEQIR